MDKANNLFGTTGQGGGPQNAGTVFELSPPSEPGGAWSESVLYSFGSAGDGSGPAASLTLDQNGNLYGTTLGGGVACALGQCGTVFELSPGSQPGAPWTETILHAFSFNPLEQSFDGALPRGGVTFDPSGNLYGSTAAGGNGCDSSNGCGTVFQLKPPTQQGGAWTENVLYSFFGFGGPAGPSGNLLLAHGAIWGTTSAEGDGYVFEIAPSQGGATFTIIYSFQGGNDGATPVGGLISDAQSNVFGTTFAGGTGNAGTVFELSPPSPQGGAWTERILFAFPGFSNFSAGMFPDGGLIMGQAWLLGFTEQGGGRQCFINGVVNGCGAVFAVHE